jgi:hypothetical protein
MRATKQRDFGDTPLCEWACLVPPFNGPIRCSLIAWRPVEFTQAPNSERVASRARPDAKDGTGFCRSSLGMCGDCLRVAYDRQVTTNDSPTGLARGPSCAFLGA